MSRIKEHYHDQIVQGAQQVIVEPYLFKYFVQFNYMGQTHTILADSHRRILELAKQIIPEIQGVRMSHNDNEFEFTLPHMILPFLVFECENVHY